MGFRDWPWRSRTAFSPYIKVTYVKSSALWLKFTYRPGITLIRDYLYMYQRLDLCDIYNRIGYKGILRIYVTDTRFICDSH